MMLSINDVQYHVEVNGEHGPALVVLHGFTGSANDWTPFIDRWKKDVRVITLDLIGHGESGHPDDPARYSMEAVVIDIKDILNCLKIERAIFLGYSLGGRVALSFAMTYPEMVERLILESASPGLETEQERVERRCRDHELADSIEKNGIQSFITYWESIPLFASQKQIPAERRNELRTSRLLNSTIGLANSLRGMGTGEQPSWWETLAELEVPTLLIVGELDTKFCTIAKRMSERLQDNQLIMVGNAGHTVHLEQIEKFDKIVVDELHKWKDDE